MTFENLVDRDRTLFGATVIIDSNLSTTRGLMQLYDVIESHSLSQIEISLAEMQNIKNK